MADLFNHLMWTRGYQRFTTDVAGQGSIRASEEDSVETYPVYTTRNFKES